MRKCDNEYCPVSFDENNKVCKTCEHNKECINDYDEPDFLKEIFDKFDKKE